MKLRYPLAALLIGAFSFGVGASFSVANKMADTQVSRQQVGTYQDKMMYQMEALARAKEADIEKMAETVRKMDLPRGDKEAYK